MITTGTVRASVIFVDFSDAPADQTPEQAFSIISPGAPNFYKVVSYGRMNFQLEPYFTWLRMSRPSTAYGWSSLTFALHRAYIQEAVTLADPHVDFSGVQAVYVISNPQASALRNGPAFVSSIRSGGISTGENTFFNAVTSGFDMKSWGFLWLNHEVGHTMGLVDLYAFQGRTHRFVGDFSLMGLISGKAPEYLAYERWLLGWLDDNQIVCQQTNNNTTTLTAIEKEGGTKAVIVPTGYTTGVIVESRRALGYDSKLPKAGALVYTIDTSILTGQGPIQVNFSSPLAAGESVTVSNVTIKVIEATVDGDIVQITVTQ
jgi:M6 family metalloprotease-like protein